MSTILLKNATMMGLSSFRQGDMLIEGPYIAKIDSQINNKADKVIDCRGLLVLPGLIDAHVHFREPGMEKKACIKTESRAAALGGVTSYMDMPNTMPATTTIEALEDKKARAAKDSLVNYAFYLGASENNLEEVKRVDPRTIAGIKVYMGSTTGNLLLEREQELRNIFAASPTLVATHCEDNAIIDANTKAAKERYGEHIPFTMHPIIRSRDCCVKSSALAISLAQETNARLHIMHLSSAEEVEMLTPLVKSSQMQKISLHDQQISAEVCIPHLFFNESDYVRLKGFLKCNPAVKYERDRKALVAALRNGIISTIGTDHAPHEISVKNSDNYLQVSSGLPSVQYSLNTIFDLYKRGEFSLEEGIRAATINVAQRFAIEKRGALEEGYFADIAIVDTLTRHTVHQDDIVSLCKWSPFIDYTFSSSVKHTIVSGKLVVENAQIVAEGGQGQALVFNN